MSFIAFLQDKLSFDELQVVDALDTSIIDLVALADEFGDKRHDSGGESGSGHDYDRGYAEGQSEAYDRGFDEGFEAGEEYYNSYS